MTQVWQSKYWPKFTYDHERVEPYLATSSQMVGEVTGLIDGPPDTDREEFHLSQLAQEAISSFAIEGVPLDETEIQASIVASLKHRDRRGAIASGLQGLHRFGGGDDKSNVDDTAYVVESESPAPMKEGRREHL
ncbi:DUF4172 domain-containing protein [Ruegeria atlantica]|uniref:DUF4172 domain-containing protein n=1 Tax=Ruegeria atlantica TaxID=81569 RepID=UPI0014801CD9|nr:DUF4172 domain-containing protein [Ruegeria atlantica]